jgi:hypothetical protein
MHEHVIYTLVNQWSLICQALMISSLILFVNYYYLIMLMYLEDFFYLFVKIFPANPNKTMCLFRAAVLHLLNI